MAKKRHGVEQIVPKLREAEIELARGLKIPQVCKKLEVTVTCPHELYQSLC